MPRRYLYQTDAGFIIDGDPERHRTSSAFAAQMANDAMHVDVTGFENNARFVEFKVGRGTRMQVWLVATRSIAEGDEILVSYGIDYWLNQRKTCRLSRPVRHWLRPHVIAKKHIERAVGEPCSIVDLVDVVSSIYEVYIPSTRRHVTINVDVATGVVKLCAPSLHPPSD